MFRYKMPFQIGITDLAFHETPELDGGERVEFSTAALEDVKKELGELNGLLRDHGGSLTDVDVDKLGQTTEELNQAATSLMAAAEKIENMPVRAGDLGDAVYAQVEGYEGKYKNELREIAANGKAKFGNYELKGIDFVLAEQIMGELMRAKRDGKKVMGGDEEGANLSEDLQGAVKALTATGSAMGDELVPTGMAAGLWEDFFLASRVVADLPSQPMPTDPFDLPFGLGDVTWRKGTEVTATTVSDPPTSKGTLTATELLAEVNWSYSLEEDAVIAVMPALRARLAQSGGEIMDDFFVNADKTNAATGNINLDDADPADDSYYLGVGDDGLRHLWLVDNTGQGIDAGGDALADADMLNMFEKLGKYALDIGQVRIVPEIASYLAMVGLDKVRTMDLYGPSATILTGELAKYNGYPIIPSVAVPKTQADGKASTTAGNNTLGQINAYHRLGWRAGFRRGLQIEVDRDIQKRMLIMVVSIRQAQVAHGARASATHSAGIYNILV